jgi:ceramide glucosyltransferase
MTVADIARLLLLTLSALGCVYLAVSVVALMRFAHRSGAQPAASPVSILKPLHGAEPGLARRLASFCRQDFTAPIEIVFGVRNSTDPSLAAVNALRRQCPNAVVKTVVGSQASAANPKVANLVAMAAEVTRSTIVMSDSDIEVAPDYLGRVVGELEALGVGAVTCLYRGEAIGGFWSRLCALGIDAHFIPGVAVALLSRIAQPCFGSTIAMRRNVYDAIGGFEAFVDRLADDYAIGEAVRRRGWSVAIPPFLVSHACSDASLAGLWRQELRWARTNRAIAPVGYAGSIIAHPAPLALLAWLAGSPSGLVLAAAALVLRYLLCAVLERSLKVPRHPYWLLPLRDILSFAVFSWSFVNHRVVWRGERFLIGRGGHLSPARESEQ